MKIAGLWPQDGVEGNLKLYDQRGEEVAELFDAKGEPVRLSRWEWAPNFFQPQGKPIFQYLCTMDDTGVVIQRSVLIVSGTTGKADLQDRTRAVRPQVDRPPGDRRSKRPTATEPEPEPELEEPDVPAAKEKR